jgi:hypothetical protein
VTTKSSTIRRVALVSLVVAAALSTWAAGIGSATTSPRGAAGTDVQPTLVSQLALARLATAKYVGNLALAKANGYGIITKEIPNMGFHYMNPKVTGFNVQKPPILVYEHSGSTWQLGALEWVFTSKPATPPLPGAKYGAFGAGCHYKDGSYVPATSQGACPTTAPQTGAAFTFWHPNLITMHVWLWYPNPSGLFANTNPLAAPFNEG